MKTFALLNLMLLFLATGSMSQPLSTADSVDIGKYMGRWYDIASYPAFFQRGCRCSTADYEFATGKNYFKIVNRCIRFKNGKSEIISAGAKAFPVNGSGNARLKVQFFWPFRADYYIIGLDENYNWAIVGHPKRKYLWILSREAYMPSGTYNSILEIIRQKGYDVAKLVKTPQNCDKAE